jgi:alkylation response protein AidB-like acyl-CoA dehydrogenase
MSSNQSSAKGNAELDELSAEKESAFRARARKWLEANAVGRGESGDFSASHLFSAKDLSEYWLREREAFDRVVAWQRKLYESGWAGISWPKEYGGQGLPEWAEEAFSEEHARFGVSTKLLSVGLQMVASAIRVYGTPYQKARYLLPIIQAEEVWCQLFSEPDAGSDLTAIRTRALRVDDGWLVDGQKVWTSGAGVSDLGMLLARTEEGSEGRVGLACLVVDMKAKGVEVRPLREISGAYHFNEVFLSGVHVADDCLLGNDGDGWSVARTVLSSERAAIGGGTSARAAWELVETAREGNVHNDAIVRQMLAAALVRERVLDLHLQRTQEDTTVKGGGSVLKLMYSEHARLTSNAAMAILGMGAIAGEGVRSHAWEERFLFSPGLRIGGGTDEMQRNQIAERGLGLPRDSRLSSGSR